MPPYGGRMEDKMKKRLLTLVTAVSIFLSSMPVFAYELTNDAASFLNTKSEEYTSLEDFDHDKTKIAKELVENYNYSEDDAKDIIEDFRNTMEKKLNGDNIGDDKKDNEKEEQKPNEDAKKPEETDPEIIAKRNVLKQLGIITEDDFDYDKAVQRDTYATYIANMLNYGGDYQNEEGYFNFSDVTSENSNYHAIAYLINKGAVVGVGESLYSPETEITLNQASSVIVRVTGYDVYKMPNDENDVYYWNKANEMKLFSGIAANRSETLTGKDAVVLLYNLLDAKVVSLKFGSTNAEYTKNTTFLKEYMDLEYTDGVVGANSKTTLYAENGTKLDNRLKVNDEEYIFSGIDNLDSYLGKYVRVYYSPDDSEGKAIIELERYNDSVTIQASDIDRYDVTDSTLYYYGEDETKLQKERIYLDTSIIFNGVAVDYEINKKLLFEPDVGEITILDNDRDGKADVVFITSYVYYLVGIINESDPVLYDEFFIQPQIDLEDAGVEIVEDGHTVSYASLGNGNILMAKPSRVKFDSDNGYMYLDSENSTYITFEVERSAVDGDVTGFKNDKETVMIERKTYDASKWFTKTYALFGGNGKIKMPSISDSVSAKLDKYGNIIYFVKYASNELKYGYVLKTTKDEEADDETFFMKIFTQDNEMIKPQLAQKVRVHLKWGEGALSKTTYYAKNVKPSVLYEYFGGSFKNQMIKFKLDEENNVKEIYVADASNVKNEKNFGIYDKTGVDKTKDINSAMDYFVDEEVFMKCFSNYGSGAMQHYTIGGFFSVPRSDKSFYFKIPTGDASDDDYSVIPTSQLVSVSPNDFEYYDVGRDGVVKCMVQYSEPVGKTGSTKGDSFSIVITKKPEQVWDEKTDSVRYEFEGYAKEWVTRTMAKGVFGTYTFADSEMTSFKVREDQDKDHKHSQIKISDLNVGDVLIAYADKDKPHEVTGFYVSAKDIGKPLESTGELEYGTYIPLPGEQEYRPVEVHSILGTYVVKGDVIRNADNKYFFIYDKSGYIRKALVTTHTYSTDMVVIYDAKKNKVTEGTFSDIKEGDYVIVQREELAVIVRNYK